jgi:hypothetical protein
VGFQATRAFVVGKHLYPRVVLISPGPRVVLISPAGNKSHASQRSFYKHACSLAARELCQNALLAISVGRADCRIKVKNPNALAVTREPPRSQST